MYGIDTTTEEGRAAYRREHLALAAMAPEIVDAENIVFPNESSHQITNEPHFRRVW